MAAEIVKRRSLPVEEVKMCPEENRPQYRNGAGECSCLEFPIQAVWFGLLAGFLEVVVWTVQKTWFDPFGYLGRDVIWMAPLANAIVFLLPGLLLALAAYLFPGRLVHFCGTFLPAFLAVSSLLFLTYQLHPVAAIPLALGLAYQTARWARNRSSAFNSLVHRSFGWLVMLLLALIAAAQGFRFVGERSALADLPVSPAKSPNILLIVLDTVRAESLSLHGYEKPTTPNLEEFARSGAYFESAWSTSPWTLPSHASLFTGRYPHELSSGWYAPLDDTFPTLAEVLSGFGYFTSGFVANTPYCSYETGLDRGFAHYEDYSISAGEVLRSSSLIRRSMLQFFDLRRAFGQYDLLGRKNAAEINDAFLNWLDRAPRKPFFAFLNYFDAHDPYLPPSLPEALDSYTVDEYRLLCSWWFMDKGNLSPRETRVARDAYERSIAYMDGQIANLLDELRSREVLDDTVVVITSDHGEMFGEQGLYGHGNCLYRPVLEVPLLIVYPSSVPQGLRVSKPVSLRDIPATLIDLSGQEEVTTFPGISLTRFWQRSWDEDGEGLILSEIAAPCRVPPDHGRSPVAKGRMQAILRAGQRYIKNLATGSEELYDLQADPSELNNLIQDPERSKGLIELRLTLEEIASE